MLVGVAALRDLQRRGLAAPKLVIGDGYLGVTRPGTPKVAFKGGGNYCPGNPVTQILVEGSVVAPGLTPRPTGV